MAPSRYLRNLPRIYPLLRLAPPVRTFTTTPSHLAVRGPSPKNIAAARAKPTIGDIATALPATPLLTLFPPGTLKSAYKSDALPFGPATVYEVLATYFPHVSSNAAPSSALAAYLCAVHSVTPAKLAHLAKFLVHFSYTTAARDPALGPPRALVARHLVQSVAETGEPVAAAVLFRVLKGVDGSQGTTKSRQALAKAWERLRAVAGETGNGEALFAVGREQKERGNAVEALAAFVGAANAGLVEGFLEAGRGLWEVRDQEAALKAWRKGAERDGNAASECCLEIAKAIGGTGEGYERMLLRAGMGGAVGAAPLLGDFYRERAQGSDREMAKEWYTIGIGEDDDWSLLGLHLVLGSQGRSAELKDWVSEALRASGKLADVEDRVNKKDLGKQSEGHTEKRWKEKTSAS